MIIGIDVDEVLAGFVDSFLEYHNVMYQSRLRKKDITDYSLCSALECTPSEVTLRVHKFYQSENFMSIAPLFGAVDAVNLLKRDHELHIITARHHVVKNKTLEWLAMHFGNSFAQVHFSRSAGETVLMPLGKTEISKADICKSIGARVMMEDCFPYAYQCAREGIPTLLFDKPWNQLEKPDQTHPNLVRVTSWDHAIEYGLPSLFGS